MAQYFSLHPENPQPRLLKRAVEILRDGGVVAYPTDCCYALGCLIDNKNGADRIRAIRDVGKEHNFTLLCRDMRDAGLYARLTNRVFRYIKSLTPGPYTFILEATRELPRRLHNPKRRTVGIRIPGMMVAPALLDTLGEPLMSSTLILPGHDSPMTEPEEIRQSLESRVDAVVDGGPGGIDPTTVVDLVDESPRILRYGAGKEGQ